MTDEEIAALSPKMQEAVRFCQFWNLSHNLKEFLEAMGWPVDDAHRHRAQVTAYAFKKEGVTLRDLREKTSELAFDYAVLKSVAARSLAELGGRKKEAEDAIMSLEKMRTEAFTILAELRKFKDIAVDREKMKTVLVGQNGGH